MIYHYCWFDCQKKRANRNDIDNFNNTQIAGSFVAQFAVFSIITVIVIMIHMKLWQDLRIFVMLIIFKIERNIFSLLLPFILVFIFKLFFYILSVCCLVIHNLTYAFLHIDKNGSFYILVCLYDTVVFIKLFLPCVMRRYPLENIIFNVCIESFFGTFYTTINKLEIILIKQCRKYIYYFQWNFIQNFQWILIRGILSENVRINQYSGLGIVITVNATKLHNNIITTRLVSLVWKSPMDRILTRLSIRHLIPESNGLLCRVTVMEI